MMACLQEETIQTTKWPMKNLWTCLHSRHDLVIGSLIMRCHSSVQICIQDLQTSPVLLPHNFDGAMLAGPKSCAGKVEQLLVVVHVGWRYRPSITNSKLNEDLCWNFNCKPTNWIRIGHMKILRTWFNISLVLHWQQRLHQSISGRCMHCVQSSTHIRTRDNNNNGYYQGCLSVCLSLCQITASANFYSWHLNKHLVSCRCFIAINY